MHRGDAGRSGSTSFRARATVFHWRPTRPTAKPRRGGGAANRSLREERTGLRLAGLQLIGGAAAQLKNARHVDAQDGGRAKALDGGNAPRQHVAASDSQAPSARKTVTTIRSSSGISDMANAIPASSAIPASRPSTMVAARHTIADEHQHGRATIASRRTIRSVSIFAACALAAECLEAAADAAHFRARAVVSAQPTPCPVVTSVLVHVQKVLNAMTFEQFSDADPCQTALHLPGFGCPPSMKPDLSAR